MKKESSSFLKPPDHNPSPQPWLIYSRPSDPLATPCNNLTTQPPTPTITNVAPRRVKPNTLLSPVSSTFSPNPTTDWPYNLWLIPTRNLPGHQPNIHNTPPENRGRQPTLWVIHGHDVNSERPPARSGWWWWLFHLGVGGGCGGDGKGGEGWMAPPLGNQAALAVFLGDYCVCKHTAMKARLHQ